MTEQMTIGNLIGMLRQADVKPSLHRLAVLGAVCNGTHPSADEIYAALLGDTPGLSRTTVYNALHLLVEKGLLRELEIESGCLRYDIARQAPHCHFICRVCHRIFDMPLPKLPTESEIDRRGFQTESMELSFKGLCPDCQNKSNQIN